LPYGVDSTSRVALMFVFCMPEHHDTQFGIALLLSSYATKAKDSPNPSVDPGGPWTTNWGQLA